MSLISSQPPDRIFKVFLPLTLKKIHGTIFEAGKHE